jgi:hypothetical protein
MTDAQEAIAALHATGSADWVKWKLLAMRAASEIDEGLARANAADREAEQWRRRALDERAAIVRWINRVRKSDGRDGFRWLVERIEAGDHRSGGRE